MLGLKKIKSNLPKIPQTENQVQVQINAKEVIVPNCLECRTKLRDTEDECQHWRVVATVSIA